MMSYKLSQMVSLITCCLMLMAVAVNKDRKLFGHELVSDDSPQESLGMTADSVTVVSTKEIGKDIIGYGGDTPLEICIKGGVITDVKPLPNSETPAFFDKVILSNIFSHWIGRTPKEALQVKVDAVSGATFSSNAVIQTMQRGLQSVVPTTDEGEAEGSSGFSLEVIIASAALLLAMFLPLFVHFRGYRVVQLAFNVLVLGFWCGTFLSYTLLVNFFANGLHAWNSVMTVLLLIAGFAFPLFGKKSHYCTWVCPMGSCQELMGKSLRYKFRLSPKVLNALTRFREGLWCVLMLLMWSGVCFEWMDYELFTAFLFQQASWVVITIAVLFLMLSAVITRPYCRFVCPMGCLLHISQNSK